METTYLGRENNLDGFRQRITTHVTIFALFLGQLNTYVVSKPIIQGSMLIGDEVSTLANAAKAGVDRLHQHQYGQIVKEFSICSNRYTAQQIDILRQRQEGTGNWMFECDEFQRWKRNPLQTLFCPGIPGAGKTVVSAIVVDYLLTEFACDLNICLAYVYCSYQSRQELCPQIILSSLLRQLIRTRLSISRNAQSLYQHHRLQSTHLSYAELVKLLQTIARLFTRVFIIVDALDEDHGSGNEDLHPLLSDLFGLQNSTSSNLFATSRTVSEITHRFFHCLWKEIKAQSGDVLSYIQGQIPELLRPQGIRDADVQNQCVNGIVNDANGMCVFLSRHKLN